MFSSYSPLNKYTNEFRTLHWNQFEVILSSAIQTFCQASSLKMAQNHLQACTFDVQTPTVNILSEKAKKIEGEEKN